MPSPKTKLSGVNGIDTIGLKKLELLPKIHWDVGLKEEWIPGIDGAKKRLHAFLKESVIEYVEERDFPSHHGTSKLSPYLHFGELSPRQVWHAILQKYNTQMKEVEGYLRQLGWTSFITSIS